MVQVGQMTTFQPHAVGVQAPYRGGLALFSGTQKGSEILANSGLPTFLGKKSGISDMRVGHVYLLNQLGRIHGAGWQECRLEKSSGLTLLSYFTMNLSAADGEKFVNPY